MSTAFKKGVKVGYFLAKNEKKIRAKQADRKKKRVQKRINTTIPSVLSAHIASFLPDEKQRARDRVKKLQQGLRWQYARHGATGNVIKRLKRINELVKKHKLSPRDLDISYNVVMENIKKERR